MTVNKLEIIKQELKKTSALGLSMRLKLFLFLMVLVVVMVLGVIVVFLLTGTFTAGLGMNEKLFSDNLNHAFRSISKQYGQLSAQAVEFAGDLSISMENTLREKGRTVTDLQDHPEILEDLLTGEYQRALFSLQRAKSSGVFIILDATVNPKLENAADSRAGLFIKNMEPNILSASSPTILLLRGFPGIGRKNHISMHAQWSMEFDTSSAPYYRIPMLEATRQKLSLSRLYYWNPAATLPGTSEEVMLCSVSLLDSKGNVFGICGFEVSAMLFKLAHMPDSSTYTRLFCMLAPVSGNGLDTSGAMFSGGYSARSIFLQEQPLTIEKHRRSFFRYTEEGGNTYLGFHLPVEMYPRDSAFYDQKWAVALMAPAEDIKNSLAGFNFRLAVLFAVLMGLGIVISVFLSRLYIKPIIEGLDKIKSEVLDDASKTKIPEIDELIEFLSARLHEKSSRESQEKDLSSTMLNDFIKNLPTLSPAERAVFNLYVRQHTAKEIAGILCLSINTIKTHTKRIYSKLNVSSRAELLLLINMLKEAGREFK